MRSVVCFGFIGLLNISCSFPERTKEKICWLVLILYGFVRWFGLLGINCPLRQYFSLYRAVSQREGERIDESKNVQTTPPAPTASAIGPCPTVIQIVGRPGTGSLPRTIAPPDHPRHCSNVSCDDCNHQMLYVTIYQNIGGVLIVI